MIITVGTTNAAKLEAVRETITNYPHLKKARVQSRKASSDVQDQPKSLDETIRGAMNRARNAFVNCDLSIGIESGLMQVPHTKTGYMDVCVCAIYDGKEFHLGLSSAWEAPREITRLIIQEGMNMTQAANKIGLTQDKQLGANEGLLGILTKGRILRKEYTKQALMMALIQLENAHLWKI